MKALAIIVMVCMIAPQVFAKSANQFTGEGACPSSNSARAEATVIRELPGMRPTIEEAAYRKKNQKKQFAFMESLLGLGIIIGVIWYWRSGK